MPETLTELPQDPKAGQRVTLDHGDGIEWRWKYNGKTEKWELLEVVPPSSD